MSRSAQHRSGSRARRAAAVSTGTLVLCMWGSGTAMAASSPDPLPGVGSVPLVTAPPVPGPVDDVVKTVTGVVGVPDPLASAPHSDRPAGHHPRRPLGGASSAPGSPAVTTHRAHRTQRPVVSPTAVSAPIPMLGAFARGLQDGRMLLLAVAVMVIGGLAAGHIKAAQDAFRVA